MECAELKGIPNLNKFPVKDFLEHSGKLGLSWITQKVEEEKIILQPSDHMREHSTSFQQSLHAHHSTHTTKPEAAAKDKHTLCKYIYITTYTGAQQMLQKKMVTRLI